MPIRQKPTFPVAPDDAPDLHPKAPAAPHAPPRAEPWPEHELPKAPHGPKEHPAPVTPAEKWPPHVPSRRQRGLVRAPTR